jgi:hypothetical protein
MVGLGAVCATLVCALCARHPCRVGTPCFPAEPGDPRRLSSLTGWRLGAVDGAHAALRLCACAGRPAACCGPCRRSSSCWGRARTVLNSWLAQGSARSPGCNGDPLFADIAHVLGLLMPPLLHAHSAHSGHRVKPLLAVNQIPCCGARRGHARAGARGAADAAGRRTGAGLGARAARPVQARGRWHPGHRGCRRAAAGRAGAAPGAGGTGRALIGFGQGPKVPEQHVPGMSTPEGSHGRWQDRSAAGGGGLLFLPRAPARTHAKALSPVG